MEIIREIYLNRDFKIKMGKVESCYNWQIRNS